MNRLKLWVFALVVSGAALFAVREISLAARKAALEAVDARVAAAAARVGASHRALGDAASAIAVLAARDPLLGSTLQAKEPAPAPARGRRLKAPPPPPPDPAAEEAAWQEAARAAVAAAEKAAGFALPENARIAAGNREWLARRGAADGSADRPLVDLLAAGIGGETRRGLAAWNGQLWATAAAPAGAGGAIAILVPLDAAWVAVAVAGSGADLTLVAPEVKPVSTARAEAADLAAAASRPGAAVADVGALGKVELGIDAVKLPKVGLLFATAPAARAQVVPLAGMKGASAVVSAGTQRLLAPVVRMQWALLAGVAGILLLGLGVGFLVGPTEIAAKVPEALLTAAERIEKGDLAVRAPALAGQLGAVAVALNRALDAAARPAAADAPSVSQEFFAKPAAPAPAEPTAFDLPPRGDPAPAPGRLGGGAFEAAPVPAPRAQPAPAPAAVPAPAAPAPELLQAAARAAPAPGDVASEDGHWREVFQDFLRVRGECGETADGLTFERFRQKLESNKANLVAKYGCRTVRFQVYVKEGKAALKATPVK